MEDMLFGVILFIGTAYYDPISELIYALADWVRSRIKRK
jgi:hypothetical protein